jgi:hypothetical protein
MYGAQNIVQWRGLFEYGNDTSATIKAWKCLILLKQEIHIINFIGKSLHLHYKDQLIDTVLGNSRCLL